MQPPSWVQWLASAATILSFPVTLLSLNATFDVRPVEVTFPEMPFGAAIKIIAFLLLSVVFAVAFAAWYRVFDTRLRVDRLVLVPILGLASAAQSFALVEVLFGSFSTQGRPAAFGLGLGAALAIEIRYMLRGRHRNELALLAMHALTYAAFATVIAVEANRQGSDADLLMFLFTLLAVALPLCPLMVAVEHEARAAAGGPR